MSGTKDLGINNSNFYWEILLIVSDNISNYIIAFRNFMEKFQEFKILWHIPPSKPKEFYADSSKHSKLLKPCEFGNISLTNFRSCFPILLSELRVITKISKWKIKFWKTSQGSLWTVTLSSYNLRSEGQPFMDK